MRNLSFASSSSSTSSPPSSPDGPRRMTLIRSAAGIPFSWEDLPGIPKKQTPTTQAAKDIPALQAPLSLLLPQPPSGAAKSRSFDLRKKSSSLTIRRTQLRDPFIAAMVECCKGCDDDDDIVSSIDASGCRGSSAGGGRLRIGARLSRSISDRFGFVNAHTSCKRSCAVSQTIIRLPTPSTE